MKVSKCSESKVEPKVLTFEQIKEQEGIYKAIGLNMRFISLRDGGGDFPDVIVYFDGRLESTVRGNWIEQKFIRTNETLCMEVRPESDSE